MQKRNILDQINMMTLLYFLKKHIEDDVACRFRVRFSSVLLNLYPSAAAEIVLGKV